MQVLSFTEFRGNLKKNLDSVTDDGEIVFVNRPDKKAVVILSLEEYNSMLETMHLTESAKNRQRLEEAISRAQSSFEKHDLID